MASLPNSPYHLRLINTFAELHRKEFQKLPIWECWVCNLLKSLTFNRVFLIFPAFIPVVHSMAPARSFGQFLPGRSRKCVERAVSHRADHWCCLNCWNPSPPADCIALCTGHKDRWQTAWHPTDQFPIFRTIPFPLTGNSLPIERVELDSWLLVCTLRPPSSSVRRPTQPRPEPFYRNNFLCLKDCVWC